MEDQCPRKLEIVLPIPMPTWNTLLGAHWGVKDKCVALIHRFVLASITHGNDWPTLMDFRGKQQSTDLLLLEYLQTIRHNKSRKSDITKLKAAQKKPGS